MNRFPPQGGASRGEFDATRNALGYKTIINHITNPKFSLGTTNWDTGYGTFSVVNGVGKVVGSGTGKAPQFRQANICPLVAGDKYLIRAKLTVDNDSALGFSINPYGSVTSGLKKLASIYTPIADTEYTVEVEFIVTTQTGNLGIQIATEYADAETAAGKATYCSYAEVINMTETFGVGNEPEISMLSDIITKQLGGELVGSGTIFYPCYAGDIFDNSPLSKRISSLHGKTIVCMGDSITADVDDFPGKLADLTGATVYDCGVGGTRLTGGGSDYGAFSMVALTDAYDTGTWTVQDAANANLNLSNYSLIKEMDFDTVDYLILFFGANDFGMDTPMGDSSSDKTYFVGAIYYIINKLCTKFPHLKICFITPPYRARIASGDGKDTDTNPNNISLYLKDYVDALVLNAGLNHVPCLDLWRNSGINKYNHTIWLDDGLHPNAKGTQLIAEKIQAFLRSIAS